MEQSKRYSGQGGYRGPRPDLAARNRGTGPRVYEDREWMRVRFEDRMRTFREIAAEGGCSLRTVARWMHIHRIAVPASTVRRAERGTVVSGSAHRNWKGGPPRCDCGKRKDYASRTCMGCRDFSGSNHPNWRGDGIKNPQMHGRVVALRGLAQTHRCAHCGGPAAHWAYDHNDPDEKPDSEGPYSLDPAHYMAMCVGCHKRFDMAYLRRMRRLVVLPGDPDQGARR